MLKRIGILGGLGPYPTLVMVSNILSQSKRINACADQDYPNMTIAMECDTPDRTEALLRSGPDPFPAMLRGLRHLEKSKCDFAIITCNTAHAWIDPLRDQAVIPILDMLDETKNHIEALANDRKSIWLLLATDGTIQTHLYQKRFLNSRVQIIAPEVGSHFQKLVMEAIYGSDGVKAGYNVSNIKKFNAEDSTPTNKLLTVINHYAETDGISGVILGCTELPLAISKKFTTIPLIDPMSVVAERAVEIAHGLRPLPLNQLKTKVTSFFLQCEASTGQQQESNQTPPKLKSHL